MVFSLVAIVYALVDALVLATISVPSIRIGSAASVGLFHSIVTLDSVVTLGTVVTFDLGVTIDTRLELVDDVIDVVVLSIKVSDAFESLVRSPLRSNPTGTPMSKIPRRKTNTITVTIFSVWFIFRN